MTTLTALRDRARHNLPTLVLIAPALLLLERAWQRRWTTDDGFINFRVARMVLEGHGPVFNAGERVEATTSTVWLWLLVMGDLLMPLKLEWVAVVLGIGCATAGVLAATRGAVRLQRSLGVDSLLLPAGTLIFVALPPVWEFSTSGLEGGLTFGWLGLVSFLLARWAAQPDRSLGAVSAAVIGLGWLIRPDLALMSFVALAGVLGVQWSADRPRDRLRLLAAAMALPLVYQVFRMGYYANVVPNTAQAKAGAGSRWGTGFHYLRDFVQPYWLLVPLLALLVTVLAPSLRRAGTRGDRRAMVALSALPLAGLLHATYVVRVGGDYMHARLLLPSLAALVLPLAVAPVPRLRLRAGREDNGTGTGAARALMLGGLTVIGFWAVVSFGTLRSHTVVPDLFSADAHRGHVALFGEHAVTADDQWKDHRPVAGESPVVTELGPLPVDPPDDLRTPAYAGHGIGLSGYVYGPEVYVLDMLGLGDPVTSRFEVPHRGLTGHEKQLPMPWLAARVSREGLASDVLRENPLSRPLYESPPGREVADAAAARSALECGDLADLRTAVTEPMTPGRFAANLWSAPRFSRLAVPADPNRAFERFCD